MSGNVIRKGKVIKYNEIKSNLWLSEETVAPRCNNDQDHQLQTRVNFVYFEYLLFSHNQLLNKHLNIPPLEGILHTKIMWTIYLSPMGGLTNLKIPEKSTIVIIIIVIILVIIILLSITISRHPPPYHVNNQFIADGSLNYSAGSLFAVSPLPKLYLHLFYTMLSMHRSEPLSFLVRHHTF